MLAPPTRKLCRARTIRLDPAAATAALTGTERRGSFAPGSSRIVLPGKAGEAGEVTALTPVAAGAAEPPVVSAVTFERASPETTAFPAGASWARIPSSPVRRSDPMTASLTAGWRRVVFMSNGVVKLKKENQWERSVPRSDDGPPPCRGLRRNNQRPRAGIEDTQSSSGRCARSGRRQRGTARSSPNSSNSPGTPRDNPPRS